MHFSLIFIGIHSIIGLSQSDLDQIKSNFLYSLVHSIVNLNINRGEAEHQKHENILKTHLIVFPCFFVNVYTWTRGFFFFEYLTVFWGFVDFFFFECITVYYMHGYTCKKKAKQKSCMCNRLFIHGYTYKKIGKKKLHM